MFLNTRRKLTVLNSLVFLLIFIIFMAILYSYLYSRLFNRIDGVMLSQAKSIRLVNGRIVPSGRPLFDPRIFILLRGTDGRILNPIHFQPAELENLEKIAATVNAGTVETREYDGHTFRMANVPYCYADNIYNVDGEMLVQAVIAISVVDPEVELLRSFLVITVVGTLVSMFAIIIAGYLLAKRAMIPIQAAWLRQQQFVSDASHELRSPITGIYSNAELMLRHPERTIEQERNRIDTIIEESTRMTKLIANLLTLARTDANKAELHLEPVNISKIIAEAVARFRPMEEIKGISLNVMANPNLELLADKERLHQLVVILLDNAFKYTSQGGQIRIYCSRADKSILISVEDTGSGIVPEHLPKIFDRFFRGDKARSRESGGTGLGLAIAKWIVEKHKGKIVVESEPGKGSRFTIYLPMNRS
ncbi:MAG: integral rane sensor signal transduction histidine kinase [Firmicutes bacterium]|nr:integral rane sensor signal transduction histidine kinase [Bacillota bacterium]